MMKTPIHKHLLLILMFILPLVVLAKTEQSENNNLQQVYQLQYIEREQGIDDYETIMYVSDRYIRIEDPAEDSGFILYDDKNKIIYSVNHLNESVLVIKEHVFTEKDSPVKYEMEYLQLADA
ncbi:MAG: hypothetical protein KAI17_00855, partial [Thiotrichaceae bacterium]|nr:hypothetical protein [Thiotrichaceae bacterium]